MQNIKNIIGFLLISGVLLMNASFAYATTTWAQTDWVGGSGQATWSDATMYNTAGGENIWDTTAGQIRMKINAANVVGQADFTHNSANRGGSVSASTLSGASEAIIVGTKLIIVDTGNNRVLIYNTIPASDGVSADIVIGQADLTHAAANRGGAIASNTLSTPYGIYSDGTKLFIADSSNSRVLVYNTIPATQEAAELGGDFVLGQADLTHGVANRGGAIASNTLYIPEGVYSDGTKLFITDSGNNRVLIYNTTPTTQEAAELGANVVIGQENMTLGDINRGIYLPTDANMFYTPRKVYSDGTKLFVTDGGNSRVLVYNTIPTINDVSADIVIGQKEQLGHGAFYWCGANQGTDQAEMGDCTFATPGSAAADTLYQPFGIYSDGTKLFIADDVNHRILVYNTIPTANTPSADIVIGQADMVSGSWGISASGFSGYYKSVYANSSKIIITDANRVLLFDLSTPHQSTLTSSAYDSGDPNTFWGPLTYNATTPANTSVSFEVSTDGGTTWQT
ncbi:MAG: hypothetical protein WC870_02550, partial [Candidatus Paceibacterota bacterium]